MSSRPYLRILSLLAGFLTALAACDRTDTRIVTRVVRVEVSATAGPTATPTGTPSPTPTPTPTARPVSISGDPAALRDLVAQPDGAAGCARVDYVDFPLSPPNAESARGGGDFGRFRSRYQKFHAGEDWGFSRSTSFGTPVYSIANGVVTYAQPLGWGVDQGVVILRHQFPDGRTVLSFYGHLDPPSVTLRAGDCVARGGQVGRIGDPRGRPHLHFEIRTHLPDTPGPGYWPSDPTRVGWLAPSPFIWSERLRLAPGVLWARAPAGGPIQPIGPAGDGVLLALEGDQLVGLDLTDGSPRWTLPVSDTLSTAGQDLAGTALYLADQLGGVKAFRPSDSGARDAASLQPAWELDLDGVGRPNLLPLPGGGAALYLGGTLTGLSPDGEVLWRMEVPEAPVDSMPFDGELIFTSGTTEGRLWTVGSRGPEPWPVRLTGRLAAAGERVFLLGVDGLHRLDPDERQAALLYTFPASPFDLGEIVGLPDGGALVARTQALDRRLLRFDARGVLLWERSFAGGITGEPRLASSPEGAFLLAQDGSGSGGEIALYEVDLDTATLRPLFWGGTRSANSREADAWWLDERLVIQIGGGHLVAFDPRAAREAIGAP